MIPHQSDCGNQQFTREAHWVWISYGDISE